MTELWEKIRAARKEAGITQQQLADACGTTRTAVSLWESKNPEKRTSPTFARMKIIAAITGKPLSWLVDVESAQSMVTDRMRSVATPKLEENPFDLGEVMAALHNVASLELGDEAGNAIVESVRNSIKKSQKDLPTIDRLSFARGLLLLAGDNPLLTLIDAIIESVQEDIGGGQDVSLADRLASIESPQVTLE